MPKNFISFILVIAVIFVCAPAAAHHSRPVPEDTQEVVKEKKRESGFRLFKKRAEAQEAVIEEAEEAVPVVVEMEEPAEKSALFAAWEECEWSYSPETLDSLLTSMHSYNTVAAFEEFFNDFIQLDTTEILTSSIPDTVYQARLKAILSPIGLPWNDVVKQFVISYTTNRRTTMANVLSRSQYYFPIIEQELMNAGLPLELRMLPVVESALSPSARSRAGAMGLWQFMYATGKIYGLEITTFVDMRCDPVSSTKAACRYLRDLYKMYGDWTLALAAYNCGPGNVNKAFKRAGDQAKNYWDIYPYLPTETRNYVPSFIAATYAYNYHKQHDIPIRECHLPLAADTVTVRRLLHLSQVATTLDIPLETLEMLNPQYIKDIVPALDKAYPLVLPQNDMTRFIACEEEIYGKEQQYLAEYLNPANMDATKAILVATATTHKVKSGENLGSIARKYGVTVNQIVKWNNLKSPNSLKIGQKLEIHK